VRWGTESARLGDGQLYFIYQADQAVEALVSFTYSPRWSATLDGQPIPLREYQHLMQVSLPAGYHRLLIDYLPYGTLWPQLGVLAGGGGLGLLFIIIAVDSALWQRRQEGEAGLPAGDERTASRASNITYSSCINCGFAFAEVLPPTPGTYPFNLISCPICGQRLDGTGYQAGRKLTLADRQAALGRWLVHRGKDLATVDARSDFGVDYFFVGDAFELPESGKQRKK